MGTKRQVEPRINPNDVWGVEFIERLSACDNRPGRKKVYVTVVDKRGISLPWIRVRFDVEPGQGVISERPEWFGFTTDKGYVEWDHLAVPTRYVMYMGGEERPLIENIRTDLGYEYCKPPGTPWWSGHRPVNKPGVFSYRIKVRRKY